VNEPPLLLDLHGVEPAPDRLLEIARGLAGRDADRDIAVDWGLRFPWSRGVVRNAGEVFPEQLVAQVTDALAAGGTPVLIVLSRVPPPDSRPHGALRHLERAARANDAEWTPALRKHVTDLLEDAIELATAASGFAVPAGAPHAGVVRRVRDELNVGFAEVERGFPEVLSSVEIALARTGDALAVDRALVEQHDAIAENRSTAWNLVAEAHEALLTLGEGAYRAHGDDTASLLRELGVAIRALTRYRRSFEEMYRGIAVPGSAGAQVERLIRPLREQHSNLRVRLASVRSLR
jgi:hypothetical protein